MFFGNKKIINFDDSYFGLDLSDLSVKVLQLDKKGDIDRVGSFNSINIPTGCMDNGKIINREKVVEIIKEVIKMAGPKKIATNKVICSIPESKVFLRSISIPKINKNEAEEAVKWEIEAGIPLSIDQVYYDWQFLDQLEGRQDVLTVAVAKETVNELMSILESCGLSVYGLEMESIATGRSLISKSSKKGEVFLIIDMGGEKTSFIITENNVPHFTSSIPFSSSAISEVIASQMNITREEAEKIKISHGVYSNTKDDSIFNIMKPFLENLSVEVEKTMDFYQNMFKDSQEVSKIIISGGGANLKGIIPYFSARFSKQVAMGDPWINLNLGKNLPSIGKNESTRYATAIGLAMRKINYGDKA